ncbi:MAG: arginine--tRNA ligase, partial [Oxalobacteraceae bacterium]
MLATQKNQIISLFRAALAPLLAEAANPGLQPNVVLERPRDPPHGDVACNIALQLAKPMKKSPRQLAESLVAAVMADPARVGLVEAVEIAGPGFINLRLSAQARQAVVGEIMGQANAYGRGEQGA